LGRFETLGLLANMLITFPPDAEQEFERLLRDAFPESSFLLVPGGAERQASVRKALDALDDSSDIVVIHDAARPFVAPPSVQASIAAAAEFGAATVAIPCSDTILVGEQGDFLVDTPDRRRLWACQTPQTFRVEVIRSAHERARAEGFVGTDDATLVQRAGGRVKLVKGTPHNFKITTPDDLALAEAIVAKGLV
jgi:2-C-methyl-D-erythritol 4-phosphate cytidylyltransferase